MLPVQLHSLYFQPSALAVEKVRVPLCLIQGYQNSSRNIAPLYM